MQIEFDTKFYSQCLNKSLIDSGAHSKIRSSRPKNIVLQVKNDN